MPNGYEHGPLPEDLPAAKGRILTPRPPSPGILLWFDKADMAVEVHRHDREDLWVVWVSNGLTGANWEGSPLAGCTGEEDARLVAHALEQLRASRQP